MESTSRPAHGWWYAYASLLLVIAATVLWGRDTLPVWYAHSLLVLCGFGASALIGWYLGYRHTARDIAESPLWWTLYTRPLTYQEERDQMAESSHDHDMAA